MAITRKKLWIYGIIFFVIIAAIGTYRFYKSKFLGNTLPETVNNQSGGLYRISYDTIIVDELGGSLVVNKVVVAVDTAYLDKDTASGEQPSMLISLTADTLRVTGVETPRALLNKEITGSKLLIKNASIELFRLTGKNNSRKKDSTLTGDPIEEIYYDVLRQLQLVKMDTIMLENIDLSYRDFKTKKLILRSANVSINLFDLLIDDGSLRDKSRILFAKNVELTADSIHFRDPETHYDFDFNGLAINTAQRTLALKSATIGPQQGEFEYVSLFKTQKDRFDFELSSILLKGIDPVSLSDGGLLADTLFVKSSRFKIYRNLNITRDNVKRVGQYPHQVIMKVPFPMNIRQGFFSNSFVQYKEVNEKTDKVGIVTFNRASATMHNITNDKSAIAKNNILTVGFNAWFLNVAKVDVRMSLRIGDEQGRFAVKGDLGPFDARAVNALTEPMGLARVERGKVNGLHFDMTGNNYEGDGKLTMTYEKLKISSLKLGDEEDDKEFKRKGITSLLANMLVKNNNPSGGKLRSADMHTERNTNRSFFNIIWKSIFTGVKETVGMDMLGKKQKPDPDKPGEKKKKDKK